MNDSTSPAATEAGRIQAPTVLPQRLARGFKAGFTALSVRNYRLYWSGQIVSLIGTWMQQVSLPWLVLILGGSAWQLGIVAALQYAPTLVLSPFGGVMADRVDKRKALLFTQIAAMTQAAVLFALVISGNIEIWQVMCLALALGLVSAVEMPLRQSFAADLVPREMLPNAIALNSVAFNSARVLGPALAGLLIALFANLFGSALLGIAVNLGLNALTYGAVFVSLWLMNSAQIRPIMRPEQAQSIFASLGEGFNYARRTANVRWPLILLGGVALLGFNFQILLPLFARDSLALDAGGYGLLFAAMGAGSFAGSMTLAFVRTRRIWRLMLGAAVLFMAAEICLGLMREAWLAGAFLVVAGYFSMLMINTINVTVQNNVPDYLRGRIMALYVTVFAGSAPLGALFAGGLAEILGAAAAFIIGASLAILVVLAIAWRTVRYGRSAKAIA